VSKISPEEMQSAMSRFQPIEVPEYLYEVTLSWIKWRKGGRHLPTEYRTEVRACHVEEAAQLAIDELEERHKDARLEGCALSAKPREEDNASD
jgi:hypothetical protein